MYYLLENNMILSDKQCNKYINYEDKNNQYVIFEDNENGNITSIDFVNNYVPVNKFYSISKIKNQSENIWDLVDRENDLLKLVLLNDYVNIIQAKSVNGKFEDLNFCAIYKPNSKGDYIKVWERNYINNGK